MHAFRVILQNMKIDQSLYNSKNIFIIFLFDVSYFSMELLHLSQVRI